MHDCCSFTCYLSWTLGSFPKCSQLKYFLYIYYFVRYSSELSQFVPLLYSQGRCTHYSDSLHDFSVRISRCYKDVYINSFFLRIARLWNSLPIEFFPLSYDWNGFKSRINRLSKQIFLYTLIFFVFVFLVTPCLIVAV